jgi:hypothetical protein
MSRYLHTYFLNEIRLHSVDELRRWQARLTALFGYMLRHGMPMEQVQLATFKEALFQSRNAEEALLVALNACARQTGQVSPSICHMWTPSERGLNGSRARGLVPSLSLRPLVFLF